MYRRRRCHDGVGDHCHAIVGSRTGPYRLWSPAARSSDPQYAAARGRARRPMARLCSSRRRQIRRTRHPARPKDIKQLGTTASTTMTMCQRRLRRLAPRSGTMNRQTPRHHGASNATGAAAMPPPPPPGVSPASPSVADRKLTPPRLVPKRPAHRDRAPGGVPILKNPI